MIDGRHAGRVFRSRSHEPDNKITFVSCPHDGLLDRDQAETLSMVLGAEDWQHAIDTFHSQAQGEIEAIRTALATGQPIRRLAHGLKGMAINIGARDFATTIRRIEDAAPDEAVELTRDLTGLLERTVTALRAVDG